jgi:peptide/nickel transport system permease protein
MTVGAAILVLLVAIAAAGPFLAGNPFSTAALPLLPPGWDYPFGTDDLGRDVLSGVIHGARTSLYAGVSASVIAATLGLLVGGLSAIGRGAADSVLMRGTDFAQALPRFLLVVTIVSLFGHSFALIILTIGLTEWPVTARLFRAQARSTLEREFVLAARAAGAGDLAILWRHVLPAALPVMGAQISYHAGGAILIESGLSLLGLGDPAVMSWGTLLGGALRFMREAWWMSVFPGLAVTLTVLGCNLVAEGATRRS